MVVPTALIACIATVITALRRRCIVAPLGSRLTEVCGRRALALAKALESGLPGAQSRWRCTFLSLPLVRAHALAITGFAIATAATATTASTAT